jgi:hypothetical protein
MLSCDISGNGIGAALSQHYSQPVIGASQGHITLSPLGGGTPYFYYHPKNPNAKIVEF